MSIVAIPGYSVQKIGKDKYSVAVTNGNMGAAVVNKEQLQTLADIYGVKVKDNSTAKKVIGGLVAAGAVAAGIVYRKNIGKFFKGIKDGKVGELVDAAKIKVVAGTETVKEAVTAGAGKVKDKAGKWYNKVADWIVGAWKSVKNFFKGLFGKKVDAVQQELPFPKGNSVNIFSEFGDKVKEMWNGFKNLFARNNLETERLWEYRLAKQQPVNFPKVNREVDLLYKFGVAKF